MERGADELRAGVAAHLAHLVVDVTDEALGVDGHEAVDRALDEAPQVGLLFAQLLLELLVLGHVAGGCEHALEPAVLVVEGGGVVGNERGPPVLGPRHQLVVGDLPLLEGEADALLGALGVGEVGLEGRADELVSRAPGERLHLLVDIGDDPEGVRGHQRVDVRLDQRAGVELRAPELLLELGLRGDVAGRGEDAPHLPGAVAEDRGVERDGELAAVGPLQGEHVVGDRPLLEDQAHPLDRPRRLREVNAARRDGVRPQSRRRRGAVAAPSDAVSDGRGPPAGPTSWRSSPHLSAPPRPPIPVPPTTWRGRSGRRSPCHPGIAPGAPFLIAGIVKGAYDLVLWRWFRKVELPAEAEEAPTDQPRVRSIEEAAT